MKKELDSKGIINELSGNSGFFPKIPYTPKNVTDGVEHSVTKSVSTEQRNYIPTEDNNLLNTLKTGSVEKKREYYRDAFDLYTDQRELLAEIQRKYEDKYKAKIKKSTILREALDHYLPQLLELLQ